MAMAKDSTVVGVNPDACIERHKTISQWQELHTEIDADRAKNLQKELSELKTTLKATERSLHLAVKEETTRIWKKVDSLCIKIDDKLLPALQATDKAGAIADTRHETRFTTVARMLGFIIGSGTIGGAIVFLLTMLFGG
jgi:hypothetical protein